ncbi:hypothetical protein ABPG74_005674 [Tetrahymena malaccensis]
MSFQTDLYMACPCHDNKIPEECQTPCYWYHQCTNNISKIYQRVDSNLNLTCSVCNSSNHIRNYNYYCNKYSRYMPYQNNSPQANIILAQQLANPRLSIAQRKFVETLLATLVKEQAS